MSALYSSARAEGAQSRAAWGLQTQLVDFLETGWTEPDDGIWEVRGPRRHFTHSKVMAWVAVDRAVRTLEEWPDLDGPLDDLARAARRHLQRGLRQGVQQGRRRLHPVLRVGPARRQRAHDPPGGLPAARRPPGGEHGRGDAAGAHGPWLRAALPHERRRRRRRPDRAGGRLPGLLVLAGRLPRT